MLHCVRPQKAVHICYTVSDPRRRCTYATLRQIPEGSAHMLHCVRSQKAVHICYTVSDPRRRCTYATLRQIPEGGVRSRATVGHPQATKMYSEEKLYSIRSLVVAHILNFQPDLVVMRFIRIELIMSSTSKVNRVNNTYTVCT
jgi:hypothetical protein